MSLRKKSLTEEIGTLGVLLRLPFEALVDQVYTVLSERFPEIRPAHGSVLRHILPEGSRVTDLAERAQITKQSMAYLVDTMHQAGYLEMLPDPTDGRAKLVRLTERGVQVQQVAKSISQQIETEWTNKLGAQNMLRLRSLLEQLNACLFEDEKVQKAR